MSYGKILSHPVGDANFFNDLFVSKSGSCHLYGNYTENGRLKRPILGFSGLRWFRHILADPITFWVIRGEGRGWIWVKQTYIPTRVRKTRGVSQVGVAFTIQMFRPPPGRARERCTAAPWKFF